MSQLPPIISQWIEHLNDKNAPIHIRENYHQMLQSVMIACETEIQKFALEQSKWYETRTKRGRKPELSKIRVFREDDPKCGRG